MDKTQNTKHTKPQNTKRRLPPTEEHHLVRQGFLLRAPPRAAPRPPVFPGPLVSRAQQLATTDTAAWAPQHGLVMVETFEAGGQSHGGAHAWEPTMPLQA